MAVRSFERTVAQMDPSSTPDPAAALRAAGLSPASTFGALFIGYAFASM